MSNFKHPGYVYVLVNDSLPGTVKIGYTSRAIKERINELSDTGIPSDYMEYFMKFVEDAPAVEEAIHVRLFGNRTNMDREFFKIHPDKAVKHLEFEEMKYRDQLQEDLLKRKKGYPSYLTKEYSNQKFGDLVNLLIDRSGSSPIGFEQMAAQLKVNEKTMKSLIYVLESQPMKILYTQGFKGKHKADLKYNLYVKFGENQLKELSNKYPKISFTKSINKINKNVVKKPLIKKEFLKKTTENIVLSTNELSVLTDVIVILNDYNQKYLESKKLNDKTKLTRRFFSIQELSKISSISEKNIEHIITKCAKDSKLNKLIYHFEKGNKFSLHSDFDIKILNDIIDEKISESKDTVPDNKDLATKKKTRRSTRKVVRP